MKTLLILSVIFFTSCSVLNQPSKGNKAVIAAAAEMTGCFSGSIHIISSEKQMGGEIWHVSTCIGQIKLYYNGSEYVVMQR